MKQMKRSSSGYTLVEVMVAISVLAVGVTGILSMENAAVLANRRAHEVTMATNIARRWQEILRTDALTWNRPSSRAGGSDLASDTTYLCHIVGCGGGSARLDTWFVPQVSANVAPAYDHFGNATSIAVPATLKYCVNLRYSWVRPPTTNPPDQGVIRAEVRVWWYREGVNYEPMYANCGTGAALETIGRDVSRIHSVYEVATVVGMPL
jgi:prepilin-type N-terminal cleavage/methylation domain-containing protein